LNNRGQFSIIAALLVAIILIATVVITYSTIRNSPIQQQPQVLSAIDETNLALKQVLGFTVGYYGSVLQITGNSTYAKMLAANYLQSGLMNIGNMHPDWGISFNVSLLDMRAYWFANSSYSMGNIVVNYSLTGLGMYGVTYQTSCKLSVQTGASTPDGQMYIVVAEDEDEPLINLGKQNFKFYCYVQENSTWVKKNPDSEPVAFANGTYLIDAPQGVDPYSYVVLVEDPRGIVVIASSFSAYACSIQWNPQYIETKYAVTGSPLAVTGAPDGNYATVAKGTTCEVTDYQGGTGIIRQVYFNITYYGSGTGTLNWSYRLDGGTWNNIEELPQGGSAPSPLTRTYNATSLRAAWTWTNLNTTDIQFQNNLNNQDAYVDSMYVTLLVEKDIYANLKDATVVVELLQNGTMRWLGQNLQITTSLKPVPPLPVKAIHVNQTINGVNQQVPFQIEDWASNFQIPLGLTNNASVFNSGNMVVFLMNPNVSKVTVWWNGSDTAVQTSYAYSNRYFVDDPSRGILYNKILNLTVDFSGDNFRVTSKLGTVQNTANFMRINGEWSVYGSDPVFAIYNGSVRDIIHAEPEWDTSMGGGGAKDCPNLYAHIVITLPANATYYTYQFKLMFIQSSLNRNISDLCLLQLQTTVQQSTWGSSWSSTLTENDINSTGYPIVSNSPGFFYNSSNVWEHHWSEFIENNHGFGVMTTDEQNLRLYTFDSIAGGKTGGINITDSRSYSSQTATIEIKPVSSLARVYPFTQKFDALWYGAVATFDGEKPIYPDAGGSTGLWIIAEYPPTITLTTENWV
jgi:hypothetical protein